MQGSLSGLDSPHRPHSGLDRVHCSLDKFKFQRCVLEEGMWRVNSCFAIYTTNKTTTSNSMQSGIYLFGTNHSKIVQVWKRKRGQERIYKRLGDDKRRRGFIKSVNGVKNAKEVLRSAQTSNASRIRQQLISADKSVIFKLLMV